MNRLRKASILFSFIGTCLVIEYLSHKRLVPPHHVKTLAAFIQWQPNITDFAFSSTTGTNHLIAFGPKSSYLFLSSGPSAYVFNPSGKLIDWCPDIGDDFIFEEQWHAEDAHHNLTPMSPAQLLAWPSSTHSTTLPSAIPSAQLQH